MIAFRIRINGKDVTASDDVTVFTMVAEERGERECRVALHAAGADMRLHSLAAHLRAGDEVTIDVVDPDEMPARGPECCTFCGREPQDVSSLVAGGSSAICDHCVRVFSASLTSGPECLRSCADLLRESGGR